MKDPIQKMYARLAELLKEGQTFEQTWKVIIAETRSKHVRALGEDALDRRPEGLVLHEVSAAHPRVCPPVARLLIEAGESAGNFTDPIERIADPEWEILPSLRKSKKYPLLKVLGACARFGWTPAVSLKAAEEELKDKKMKKACAAFRTKLEAGGTYADAGAEAPGLLPEPIPALLDLWDRASHVSFGLVFAAEAVIRGDLDRLIPVMEAVLEEAAQTGDEKAALLKLNDAAGTGSD